MLRASIVFRPFLATSLSLCMTLGTLPALAASTPKAHKMETTAATKKAFPAKSVATKAAPAAQGITSTTSNANGDRPLIVHQTLPSGQQVYVQAIHSEPIVTIDTWVNTGSAQEIPKNNGVSHFLEHLLFKGTATYKVGEVDRILESRGANFNAATSDDYTHFHITTAKAYYQEALAMHADMLLNATINPPELQRERAVVQEEINRSLDNPERKAFIALDKLMFAGHPYAMDTLGPKSNIQNIPREDILGYYHRWYQPGNFRTVIAGDVDAKQAIADVKAAFEKATAKQARPPIGTPEKHAIAPLTAPKAEVITDTNLTKDLLMMGFQAPGIADDRAANTALDIAGIILGQGRSSRLYQHVKEDKELVDTVGAGNSTHQQGGVFYVTAEAKPENRAAAKQAILDEIARFRVEGPTPEEVDKAKKQVVKEFAFLTESTEGVAETLGFNVTLGQLSDYTDYVANIQKVTTADVQKAAQRYLRFDRSVMAEIIPAAGEAGKNIDLKTQAAQDVALLSRANTAPVAATATPEATPDTSSQPTGIIAVTLANGAKLLMKPAPATQTIAIDLFARGGMLAEQRPGVSALAARTLFKGTDTRTAEQLSRDWDQSGITLSAGTDEDYFQIVGASLATDTGKLLTELADVLRHATFPTAEIEKERADALQDLRTSRDTPNNLLFENLTLALYPNHPYGAVGTRLEQSLPNVTRDQIVTYVRQQLRPGNMIISVAGRFDPKTIEAAFNKLLSDLPTTSATSSPRTALSSIVGNPMMPQAPVVQNFPNVPPLSQSREVAAQKPEQAATWMAYGWLAPGISTDRDYATLKVINSLLGAGLSSRLFVDLREKHGWAYHVSSMFPPQLKTSRFIMYIGTDPKNLADVRKGFDEEIKRLQTEPVTADELERVKSKVIGSFALAHESNASQAYYPGLYETLGVGYGFDRAYPELIRAVTAEDIQRVSKRIFSSPRITALVAPKVVRTEDPAAPAAAKP